MSPKKTTKFHFKIHIAKKTPKRKLFFYDENANDIAEVDEEHSARSDADNAVTPAGCFEVNSSSNAIINDDSGCFSLDSSFKSSDKTERAHKTKRLFITQRTGIDGSFWDINDSNHEAFIAIFVKKSLDVPSSQEPPSEQVTSISVGKSEELPQELSTVSVQLGEHFFLRTLDSTRMANGKEKNKKTVVQRKNEWKKKFKLRK